ncbi:glycosyltransferase family 2 protein [Spirillospora sp. NPDC047279]|uniref:glycosyltransferase family 2 protein n=1 Tax=Spirillospora sp. NPDC047279 TaxID=3155478 RepID=UPI0033FAC1BC
MTAILLSVVVPARDVAPYAAAMLRGLAGNVRPDVEFIVVDDGSADRTPEVIDDHRALLPGLTTIRHERPLGVSAARNRGLAAASGRYVTFLDGDDWVAPGHLFELVAAAEGLGCDFVRTDHVQVSGGRRLLFRAPEGRRGRVMSPRESILPPHEPTMVDYPQCYNGVYRRELADAGLLDFDERLHTAEDRPWIWRLHRRAASYAVVSLAGVHYRRDVPTSLTQIGDERQLHFFEAFDSVLAELADDPDGDLLARKAVRNYFAVIAHHLKKEERLTGELRAVLHERARTAMRAVPGELRTEVLPAMGRERMELFERTLGIGLAS